MFTIQYRLRQSFWVDLQILDKRTHALDFLRTHAIVYRKLRLVWTRGDMRPVVLAMAKDGKILENR
jgi:hypothetical protein